MARGWQTIMAPHLGEVATMRIPHPAIARPPGNAGPTSRSAQLPSRVTGWLSRGRHYIRWGDIAHILSPIAPLATVLDFVLRHDARRLESAVERRDPELVAWLAEGAELLGRLFRLEVHGLGNVPATGPAMLVGNHNGGLMPLDGLFTLAAVCRRHGPGRAVHPLAHDLVLYDRVAHRLGDRLGILRAGHASAERAFAAGDMVLVYPGSDIDTYRPWSDRHKVALAGRTGFIKLALRTRVPIVPVLAAGTHEQWVVLTRGDGLARALRTGKLLRTKVLPLALALPWGLTLGLLPYVPLPAQTTIAFGCPIAWPELGPEAADDEAIVTRCYVQVQDAMQRVLDALAEQRVPFIGQPPEAREHIDRVVAAPPADQSA